MFQESPAANPAVKEHKYHRLAEAIRRGAKLRPKQCFGAFYDLENGASCALGAAMDGAAIQHSDAFKQIYGSGVLNCKFQELRDVVQGESLGWLIQAHNDRDAWTREQIADWLETL